MKKILILFFILCFIVPFAIRTTATAKESNFKILTNKEILLVDDTLTITVRIKKCNCQSVNLLVSWNSSIISLKEVSVSGFSINQAKVLPTSVSSKENAMSNKCFGIGYTDINGENVSFDEIDIAILKFSIISSGTIEIGIREDTAGKDAFYSLSPQKITIKCVNCLHNDNVYIKNEEQPSCIKDGYTGDTYCSKCNELLKKGNILNKTEHTGGTATCNAKAKCSICNQEYGDFNPINHINETELRNQSEATHETEGYAGDIYCIGCGSLLTKGVSIPITQKDNNDTVDPEINTDNDNQTPANWISPFYLIIIFLLLIIVFLLVYILKKKG